MPFSSLLFLHLFLPLFLIVYWAAPRSAKNGVAIGASLLFYAWGAPRFLPVVLGLGLIDYYMARTIARLVEESAQAPHRRRLAKILLGLGVAMHLSILAYFKYSNFFVGELSHALTSLGLGAIPWTQVVLPIGVSFITFEEITYLCDVYRGDARPARRFSHYLLFLTLFPHSIAGPIFRWKDLEAQLAHREHSLALVRSGFERFSLGLAKKVLVADSVAIIADGCFGLPADQLTPGLAWLGALAYTIQIYFDFSGYSDMAIGLGQMIGFRFKENFNQPYLSASFTEFWTRWHISLSSWLRDYLYIPLGGNRLGRRRALTNLMIVFLLSGLWHGAAWTFVLWGAFHGVIVTLERLAGERRARLPLWLQHGTTLPLLVVSWVFFRAASSTQAFGFLRAMAGADRANASVPPPIAGLFLPSFALLALAFGVMAVLAPLAWRYRKPKPAVPAGDAAAAAPPVDRFIPWRLLPRLGFLLLFALSAMHLTNMRITPLIYFKF
jgi:alginate O-acetyltransferase complex protein AlgI